MWVYVKSRSEQLWTVGFFRPDGTWEPQSDWALEEQAAMRVHYLNGGCRGCVADPDSGCDLAALGVEVEEQRKAVRRQVGLTEGSA